MKRLVRAEVLKLRTTRTPAWLLAATLGLVALTVGVAVPSVGAKDPQVALDDPALLSTAVGTGLLITQVLVILLGVTSFTQEFRYGSATSTYLVEPRRSRVLAAKWVASALTSVALVVVTLALSAPFALVLIRSRDGNATASGQFWQMLAGGLLALTVYAILGVAIGALVRHQIAAVAGVLVWMLAVEYVVIPAFPSVGRWLPGAATWSVLDLAESNGLDGALPAPVSALVLLGYAAVAVALASVVTPRRDVH